MTIAVCFLSVVVVYLVWNQRRLHKQIAQNDTGLSNLNQALIGLLFDEGSPIRQADARSIKTSGDLMRAMRVERFITDEQTKAVALSARLLALIEGLTLSDAIIENAMTARAAALSVLIDGNGLTSNALKNLHVFRAINKVLEQAQEQIEDAVRDQSAARELMIEAQGVIERHERMVAFSDRLARARETLASATKMFANHDYASAKAAADNAKWLAVESSPN